MEHKISNYILVQEVRRKKKKELEEGVDEGGTRKTENKRVFISLTLLYVKNTFIYLFFTCFMICKRPQTSRLIFLGLINCNFLDQYYLQHNESSITSSNH